MTAHLTPLQNLKLFTHQIPAYHLTPNTSLTNHPLLIYKSAFATPPTAHTIESHLKATGVVLPQWRFTMYSTSHFHSTSHEVLGIAAGRAKLLFGHEENEGSVVVEAERGDVIVVPAGVAHRLWEDLEGGFLMVGCYPRGLDWDM